MQRRSLCPGCPPALHRSFDGGGGGIKCTAAFLGVLRGCSREMGMLRETALGLYRGVTCILGSATSQKLLGLQKNMIIRSRYRTPIKNNCKASRTKNANIDSRGLQYGAPTWRKKVSAADPPSCGPRGLLNQIMHLLPTPSIS